MSLRMAAQREGAKKWFIVVVAGYLAAFVFLTLALDGGLALGIAYGIWAASGVALTALASRILFHEPLTRVMGFGIGLIVTGVLLIELGAAH
ncbi:cation transporter [Acrocarpospora pleiomorpha]|uniref:Cation transporter n=1 Tax=Acrocarpospora pleiomorpha TaxID=90975 RepID=A0A5M3XBW0_9ACTN|nr:cation transporter [Acrocarpospora pleiomorpha]